MTKYEYSNLQKACTDQFGPGYFPQPYSRVGWYPFALVKGFRLNDKPIYLNEGSDSFQVEDLRKGWVTPFWWKASAWHKAKKSVTLFDPETVEFEE